MVPQKWSKHFILHHRGWIQIPFLTQSRWQWEAKFTKLDQDPKRKNKSNPIKIWLTSSRIRFYLNLILHNFVGTLVHRVITISQDISTLGQVVAQAVLLHQRAHHRRPWVVKTIKFMILQRRWMLHNGLKFVQKFKSQLIKKSKNSDFFGLDVGKKWAEGHRDKIHYIFQNSQNFIRLMSLFFVHSCGFYTQLLMCFLFMLLTMIRNHEEIVCDYFFWHIWNSSTSNSFTRIQYLLDRIRYYLVEEDEKLFAILWRMWSFAH